ncbi:MAG: protein O-GlcNAc transferase [bacterium]|jgi:protein O-GlcNAc transferase
MAFSDLFNKKKKVQELIDAGIAKQNGEQLNSALLDYLQAVKLDPDNLDAQKRLGEVSVLAEKFHQALRSYQRIIQLDPENQEAYNEKGKILWKQGDIEKAKKCFRIALRKFPTFEHPLYNLASIAAGSEFSDYEVKSRIQSLNVKNKVIIARPGKKADGPQISVIRDELKHEVSGIQAYAEEHPNWPDTHFNWGTALLVLKQFEDAIPVFEKALDVNPKYENAILNLGATYFYMDDHDQAKATWEKLVEINPLNKAAHLNLAREYRRVGNRFLYITEMLKAYLSQDDFRDQVIQYSGKAYIYYKDHDLDKAKIFFLRVHKMQPNYPDILLYLGNIAFKKQEFGDALQHWARGIKINSSYEAARTNLEMVSKVLIQQANSYFYSVQYDAAKKIYEDIIEAVPDHTTAHEGLLKVYGKIGDTTSFLKHKEKLDILKKGNSDSVKDNLV